jgi:predicted SAM-dependent methyltransferase
MLRALKASVVAIVGRERANTLSGPFYDWLAMRHTRRLLQSLPKTGLRVNVGCGARPLAGWINLDRARGPHVEIAWDLRHGLPFADSSCTALLVEHVLEHLSRDGAQLLLRECRRCLAPGGGLRVSLPDAERYLRSYVGDRRFLLSGTFSSAIDAPIDRVNQMMRENGHHLWAYDAELLTIFLTRAGFTGTRVELFGESRFPVLVGIDSFARREESLYVDAWYE